MNRQQQPHRTMRRTGRYIRNDRQRSPAWVWLLIILAYVLGIVVLGAGVAGVSIFTIYEPKHTYLQVITACMEHLIYSPADGVIRDLAVTMDVVYRNDNSKANVSISDFDLALGYHGATLALLRSDTFNVTPRAFMPLHYHVHTAGARLVAAGQRAMWEELRTGMVRLDLDGKARMTSKVGVFPTRQFWTRMSCRIFFNLTDGIAMTIDEKMCRSWSP